MRSSALLCASLRISELFCAPLSALPSIYASGAIHATHHQMDHPTCSETLWLKALYMYLVLVLDTILFAVTIVMLLQDCYDSTCRTCWLFCCIPFTSASSCCSYAFLLAIGFDCLQVRSSALLPLLRSSCFWSLLSDVVCSHWRP